MYRTISHVEKWRKQIVEMSMSTIPMMHKGGKAMTVEDLIDILQQMPKDKDVFIGYSNGACDYLTDRIDVIYQNGIVTIWGN